MIEKLGLTIQLPAVKPRMMAFAANMTVERYFGRRYTASRYTFSPPERGNIVPNSSQMKSPQNENKKPATQSKRDAPMEPTEPRILDGVENIPVPIIRPMLETDFEDVIRRDGRGGIHEHRTAEHTQMTTHSTSRVWYQWFVNKGLPPR